MRYVLDPAQSRFTVQAFARGLLSILGHSPTFAIRDFTGALDFDADAPAKTSFRIAVKADSLSVTDPVSARDREDIETRMRQDVLETAKYPEVVFEGAAASVDRVADGWYRLRLAGELRLHGVARPHEVEAQLRLSDGEARLSGDASLSQAAHRIREVSALGGTIKLKDELKFKFDLAGRKEA
jgi:polyisoprenoid-binding protein YceI